MPNYTAFFSFILLTAFTPGANNIMAMMNATKFGLRRSFIFCIGVFGGFILVMSICAILCSMLFDILPKVEPMMRYVGAGYIFFLAWTIFRDNDSKKEEKKSFLRPDSLINGVIMQCINVKVILYGTTAFSTFILPFYEGIPLLVFFVLLLSGIGFTGSLSWAVFGSVFQKLFTERKKFINSIMVVALIYCALSLVI